MTDTAIWHNVSYYIDGSSTQRYTSNEMQSIECIVMTWSEIHRVKYIESYCHRVKCIESSSTNASAYGVKYLESHRRVHR